MTGSPFRPAGSSQTFRAFVNDMKQRLFRSRKSPEEIHRRDAQNAVETNSKTCGKSLVTRMTELGRSELCDWEVNRIW